MRSFDLATLFILMPVSTTPFNVQLNDILQNWYFSKISPKITNQSLLINERGIVHCCLYFLLCLSVDHISFCAQGTSGKADSEGSDTSERTSQGIIKYFFKEGFNVFKKKTSSRLFLIVLMTKLALKKARKLS